MFNLYHKEDYCQLIGVPLVVCLQSPPREKPLRRGSDFDNGSVQIPPLSDGTPTIWNWNSSPYWTSLFTDLNFIRYKTNLTSRTSKETKKSSSKRLFLLDWVSRYYQNKVRLDKNLGQPSFVKSHWKEQRKRHSGRGGTNVRELQTSERAESG